jgi:hypothetical protein
MTYAIDKPERSAQDLTFELATERMAALRATTSGPVEPVATAGRGLLDRSRDAIGRGLIGLGSALVVDENVSRRTVRP